MTTPYCQINIPGPRGPAAADGANGTAGTSAVSTLTAAFIMPAELASATASVVSSSGFGVGEPVFMEFAGNFLVTAKPTATQVTLQNLKNTASSMYLSNSAPGTIIPIGAMLTPAGLQGTAGVSPAAGISASEPFILSAAASVPTPAAQVLHGLGTGVMEFDDATNAVSVQTLPYPVSKGGTGAASAAAALTALGAAPATPKYILQTPDASLASAQALSALATGYAKITTGTGAVTTQAVPIPITDGGTGGITAAAARTAQGAAASGANSDITSLTACTQITGMTTPLSVAQGGTGGNSAATARAGISAAASGANSDITSLAGLTTALTKAQGGTGAKEMPAFRAHRNGVVQTIAASSVVTLVQFNVETFDTNANYDTGAYHFEPTIAGYYRLDACVRFTGLTAADATEIYIYKNGSAIAKVHHHAGDVDDSVAVSICAQANGTTDYFDVRAAQSNAAGKDITGLDVECWFEGHWIA